ncbi:MAG TPA: hypothetical protein VNO55_00720 [Polyangia bacterium]|nr:hypothetical protein [Polyangia bacterium]
MRRSPSITAALAWACLCALGAGCHTNDVLIRARGGSGGATGTGGAPASGMTSVEQLPTAPATKLPALPGMTHVVAWQGDDSVSITFDPVDGARDYRVYALPADGDVIVSPDGGVVVHGATYRCAGTREAPPTYVDAEPMVPGGAIHALVDQQMVGGHLRTLADATLGHVYTDPGPGRVPVYALGESDPNGDTTCFFARWAASRVKVYTTSEARRADLLAQLFRDDGVAFYVPATADASTVAIYTDEHPHPPYLERWYFAEGPEADAHAARTPAFPVLKTAAPGTQPLMRVYYDNSCGWSHDELVVGSERFARVLHQGDRLPWFSLTWTGLTAPATLVVEALDAPCPFQGHLSAASVPGQTVSTGVGPVEHQPWITLDEARAASATTEVFINGQGAATEHPRAVSRAFIAVAPLPHPKMDFLATFGPGAPAEDFSAVPCGLPPCYQTWRQQSARFDQMFINAESAPPSMPGQGLFTVGPVLGELWLSWADAGAATAGLYRLTARQKPELSATTFLHVTMEVDAYATALRYPQLLISDVDAPVPYNMQHGHTLVVQPRALIGQSIDYPVRYELQVCSLRAWDASDQCPGYDLGHVLDGAGAIARLAAGDEVGEHASVDHRILFDVFASTSRAYLFLDGKPYACANLPAAGAPAAGLVTVTWGDVLFHSSADHTFAFHRAHMQVEQRRHFDNLGFSSGVPAPAWDEARFPCAAPLAF